MQLMLLSIKTGMLCQKKTYLRYKWFVMLSNLASFEGKRVIVDNVSLSDVSYYKDMGFTRFSGSFSSSQLTDMYGDTLIYDRKFEDADYIIIDPISGLFKYSNNDSTNDMDSFGYLERYGSRFEDKIICLLWAVVEKDFKVMIKISRGKIIPFVPHKLFYFFIPLSLARKDFTGFTVEDSRVKNIKLKGKQYLNPYFYSAFMSMLRDYIIVTPTVLYGDDDKIDKYSMKAFMDTAAKYIPYYKNFGLEYQLTSACIMYYKFTFKHTNKNFKLYVDDRTRTMVVSKSSSVKIVEVEPLFREAQSDIEQKYVREMYNPDEGPVVISEANINLPSTVSAFKYIRYSRVSGRDNDLKFYTPVEVFKEYEKQNTMIAHNSSYF